MLLALLIVGGVSLPWMGNDVVVIVGDRWKGVWYHRECRELLLMADGGKKGGRNFVY